MPDTVFTTPKMNARLARLWEDLLSDPVPPRPAAARFEMNELQESERREPVPAGPVSQAERERPNWRANLATWLHSLVELEESGSPSAGEEAALSIPSPFRWEPKPAWIRVPLRSTPPFSKETDRRHFAPRRSKIPIRPLHKQPFYRRFFFYLRRWLSRSGWHEADPAAR